MRQILIFLLISLKGLSTPDFTNQNAAHYSGFIGDYPAIMELTIDNGQVNGWYEYTTREGKRNVSGTLNNNYELKLIATDTDGKFTGTIDALLNEQEELNGTWVKSDKSRRHNLGFLHKNAVSLLAGLTRGGVGGKMLQASKVKGFSKLALWITIALIISVGLLGYYFSIERKKYKVTKEELKNKPKEIHTREIIHTKEIIHLYSPYDKNQSTDGMDESARKGYEFEKYIVEKFPETYYTIKVWSGDKITDSNRYAESSTHPDLLLELINESQGVRRKFAVECKYRSRFIDDEIEIAKEYQIGNYRKFGQQNKIRVFIAVGVGGNPNDPEELYIIPIEETKQNVFTKSDISKFKRKRKINTDLFFDYTKDSLN